jgi:hypothetical protein
LTSFSKEVKGMGKPPVVTVSGLWPDIVEVGEVAIVPTVHVDKPPRRGTLADLAHAVLSDKGPVSHRDALGMLRANATKEKIRMKSFDRMARKALERVGKRTVGGEWVVE